MRKETICHPDMGDTVFGNGAHSPRLSHITVEHGDQLGSPPNPIIQKLIEGGWEVHTTFSQFWFAMPRTCFTLGTPFVMDERHEFEISMEGKFFLRFRFENPTRVYLTLFYVDRAMQGKGVGREWFPRVIDALFRSGVECVWGRVEPPFYPSAWRMNQERLISFYEKNGFLNLGDERIWKFSPYRDSDPAQADKTATVSESETAEVSQP